VDTILLLFLRGPIYSGQSGNPGPLILIRHPMVSHDQRGSKVEFLQGDPEDCKKVLVSNVNVYYHYCRDDYSFYLARAFHLADRWVRLGCNFPLVGIRLMSYLVPDRVEPMAYGFLILMTRLD